MGLLTDLGIQIGHKSNRSILGQSVPDIGASEWLANTFGQGRTDQGGSNLFGDQSQTTQVPSGISGGQTQFAPSGGSGAYGITQSTPSSGYNSLGNQSQPSGGAPSSPGSNVNEFQNGYRWDGNAWQAPAGQTGPSPEELARQRIRGEIDSGYNSIFSQLDQMAGGIGQQKQSLEDQVKNMFNTGVEGLGIQRDQSTSELGAARTDVNTKQKESLRDLSGDLRNQMLAGSIYLGAQGAGDSSAAGRLAGALGKAANRNRAVVLAKANEMYNQINMQENQVMNTYREQKNNLEQWKNEKMLGVSDWANQMINNIQSQKVNATADRARALANLETQIMQEAMNRLRSLDDSVRQYAMGLDQWITERTGDVGRAKQQLAALGQYNVGNLPQTQLPGVSMGGGVPARGQYVYGSLGSEDEQQQQMPAGIGSIQNEQDSLRGFLLG